MGLGRVLNKEAGGSKVLIEEWIAIVILRVDLVLRLELGLRSCVECHVASIDALWTFIPGP